MKAQKRLIQSVCPLFFVARMFCAIWNGTVIAQDAPDIAVKRHLTTNIVVALVGYHTTREVAHGIRIPCFSTSQLDGDTNTCSILMYVIAPTNYAGEFFWLAGDDAFNQHETSNYFQLNKFYYVPLAELQLDAGVVKSKDPKLILFNLLQFDDHGTLFRLKNITAQRYFVDVSELNNRLNELEKWMEDSSKRLEELSQTQDTNIPARDRRIRMTKYKTLKGEIQWIDMLITDAIRQKPFVYEQWKILHENIPLGLGKGYLNYINLGKAETNGKNRLRE